MPLRLATWNVNSIKIRLPTLLDWLAARDAAGRGLDVVVLQETKCIDDAFPLDALSEAGWYAAFHGQKAYNGVAILSRTPLRDVVTGFSRSPDFTSADARVISATPEGLNLRVMNAYVVNGQDLGTPKYAHKLEFLAAMARHAVAERAEYPNLLIGGDYNIAPTPQDTHDPARLEGRILCSPPERQAYRAFLDAGFADAFDRVPEDVRGGRFTWWDYRIAAFARNLGMRIDHWLVSSPVATRVTGWEVDTGPRHHDRPSDHAPVVVTLAD